MSEPIFKACTRPSMLFSVPLVPLMLSNAIIFLVGMWANYFGLGLWLFILTIPNYLTLRFITKLDDANLSLLGLRFKCRRMNRNRSFYGATVYSPLPFKKR
ncbi:type IV secretion (pTiA6 VirB3) (plasmid) [Aliivibrio fischeri ES114]|uniref:Type IV secretion (PTiA6 VirB3) n=1 Tax=Aliivibrio fischeri (strain ATCC 700601 / ES114) TaxID=312309 RepID=B1WN90_ALIF1|nr:VirB3 family type IV secretion system protein [Aliivibrio fischeri]ACB55722.1 type IV secretion (pTiA6 VirB3) [Aliivibrio fischeri ES114]KLU77256.1 type VI secretion protein [Aliivibrio fischeri]MCE7575576.1 VirB3 family type IV secretion system protein [Aliivibrio fischeri]